ncbi:MAG: hypothetical protein M3069_13310 [Chloroflexota bacterium]|nr:hypothetical protein [Chloroflexota bacterium]
MWTVCLSLLFGRIAAYNLGNYRPVTNDEVELMSVAYKLATQGIPGSDLFVGFYGADQHYLFTLPLQHLLEAISFRMFGVGVAEARWVSLMAGVSIVWVAGWLAFRWYGLATAVACELLLVAWPSDLTGAPNGLPLFAVARVARYDVLAMAFTWFAIAGLEVGLRRPGGVGAFALGMGCGFAALTTLTGAFVLPLVVLVWLGARRRAAFEDRTIYWLMAGAGLVLLMWAVYAVRYQGDLAGQMAVYGGRWNAVRPAFYLANALSEPSRYGNLLRDALEPGSSTSAAGSWLLVVGVWPALAFIARRSVRVGATGDRIVLASVVVFAALLALLDQTKTPLYASILVPSLCLVMAAAWMGLLRWVRMPGQPVWASLASGTLSLVLGILIGLDAEHAYQLSLTQASQAGQYLDVGREIGSSLRPGARVLGPERWWWALHEHPYVSVRNLLFQWTAAAQSNGAGAPAEFADRVAWAEADSVIVNDNVRGDLLDFPVAVQHQFWTFIDTCTRQVGYVNDPTYLEIEVYEITPAPRPQACGTSH